MDTNERKTKEGRLKIWQEKVELEEENFVKGKKSKLESISTAWVEERKKALFGHFVLLTL